MQQDRASDQPRATAPAASTRRRGNSWINLLASPVLAALLAVLAPLAGFWVVFNNAAISSELRQLLPDLPPRADAPAVAAGGVGPIARRRHALSARVHGVTAPQDRGRSVAAEAPADGNRGRLPLRALTVARRGRRSVADPTGPPCCFSCTMNGSRRRQRELAVEQARAGELVGRGVEGVAALDSCVGAGAPKAPCIRHARVARPAACPRSER